MAPPEPPKPPPGDPTSPTPASPDNVVALSRYRAQLGRGRKLRRADALLAGPDPARAVRALPGDELYYVIHEVGLHDAGDVLALARPEQVQTVLDFALWERDEIAPERAGEWLEALAEAPYETIGEWVAGLDVELFALLLRKTSRIYDLSQEEAPDEPAGTLYPTPDGLFVLDVVGVAGEAASDDEGADAAEGGPTTASARSVIRIVDALYRADRALARRLLVGARAELDSELEELAYRWRQGRMADLGFQDYYDALEVYRELDPASVRVGETEPGKMRVRPLDERDGGDGSRPARAPATLVERLTRGASPFARAAQGLRSAEEVSELHFALVALANRVLAADRVTPGDDAAVAATLDRLVATLDLALEFLARGEEAREVEALRTVSLVRLHRLGASLVGKVKRLAATLRRRGPFAATDHDLVEPDEALALAALARQRPLFAGILDDPPSNADRPFRSLADVARATAAVERAAATHALLLGLGVAPADLGPGSTLLDDAGVDAAALDAGLLARTALVRRILAPANGEGPATRFEPLDAAQVRDFEALLEPRPEGGVKLPEVLKKKARAILEAATPARLAGAAAEVAARWIAGLAPLETVLVRRAKPAATPKPVPPSSVSPRTVDEVAAKRRTTEKPAAEKPAAKKPVAKKPVAKKPVTKKPVAKKPVAKKPVTKKPVTKKPVAEKPAAKKPVAKKPAAKKPAAAKALAGKPRRKEAKPPRARRKR
jgi:hypothetical protein